MQAPEETYTQNDARSDYDARNAPAATKHTRGRQKREQKRGRQREQNDDLLWRDTRSWVGALLDLAHREPVASNPNDHV